VAKGPTSELSNQEAGHDGCQADHGEPLDYHADGNCRKQQAEHAGHRTKASSAHQLEDAVTGEAYSSGHDDVRQESNKHYRQRLLGEKQQESSDSCGAGEQRRADWDNGDHFFSGCLYHSANGDVPDGLDQQDDATCNRE
jgi:hypothetical protein